MLSNPSSMALVRGPGALAELGKQVASLGRRCLLVTGRRALQAQGVLGRAVGLLRRSDVHVTVFAGVEPEPALETIDTARALLRSEQCDLVVGLGGGSVIDVAKATALLAQEDHPATSYFDGREVSRPGAPIVAVPSTFGSGSEATTFAVFSDPQRRLKRSIRHEKMLPTVVILDPTLGQGAPRSLTAACGLDAFTQAVESYLSRDATRWTREMSFKAVELLSVALPNALDDPFDLTARAHCADGSFLAGLAFQHAGLGVVHALANPLGGRRKVAHGELCGILLPWGLRYNREVCEEEFGRLSGILGADPLDFATGLRHACGLPDGLGHLELSESDHQELVPMIFKSSAARTNPRPLTPNGVLALLREACGSPNRKAMET